MVSDCAAFISARKVRWMDFSVFNPADGGFGAYPLKGKAG